MVDKKFNFYNVYKFYYKNMNKSVFFYNLNVFKDFSSDLYAENISRFLINYFGVFSILASNFILYTDLCIIKTILNNRNPLLETKFNLKRIFFNNPILNYTPVNFFKKNNINLYLISLK